MSFWNLNKFNVMSYISALRERERGGSTWETGAGVGLPLIMAFAELRGTRVTVARINLGATGFNVVLPW